MPRLIDLTGRKFGMLEVLQRAPGENANRKVEWFCDCECGRTKIVEGAALRNGTTKSCGCLLKRRGKDHPGYKNGKTLTAHGYVVLRPEGRYGPTIMEHRSVMEKHLGRSLTKGENVHHINGQRDDNRIKNLELWNTSQPSGQRVEDKVAHAKEILAQYEPEALL